VGRVFEKWVSQHLHSSISLCLIIGDVVEVGAEAEATMDMVTINHPATRAVKINAAHLVDQGVARAAISREELRPELISRARTDPVEGLTRATRELRLATPAMDLLRAHKLYRKVFHTFSFGTHMLTT
jgi:hypothetical protein